LLLERDVVLAQRDELAGGNCYTFNHQYLKQLYMVDRPGEEQGKIKSFIWTTVA